MSCQIRPDQGHCPYRLYCQDQAGYPLPAPPGYQPHPAFAKDTLGNPLYLNLSPEDIATKSTLADFPESGTRELIADDFVYEIKLLAHPRLHSPIYGLMIEYIAGCGNSAISCAAPIRS